jgi:cation diffusion facilitator family transporter
MHAESLDSWRHEHVFLGADHERNERRSWAVVALCGTMMAAEIVGGWLWGSMALIADGLHMSTHAGALVIAALAYSYARSHARDERFAFGTGKLGDLAAFSSAIVLAMIALLIGWESIERLTNPVAIAFDEAIPLAAIGLAVNLASAWLLREEHHDHGGLDHAHHHKHTHARDRQHGEPHQHARADYNLRAAYVHVVADAAVSLLALLGLGAGRLFGWVWMDPAMGLVGMVVILNWSWSLVRQAGAVLLDMRPEGIARQIAERLEAEGGDRVADLHLWRVGPGHHAAVVSIVCDRPEAPAFYKARLAGIAGLSHVTVEVQPCPGPH